MDLKDKEGNDIGLDDDEDDDEEENYDEDDNFIDNNEGEPEIKKKVKGEQAPAEEDVSSGQDESEDGGSVQDD